MCWKACGTVSCFCGLHSCGFSVRYKQGSMSSWKMVLSLLSLLSLLIGTFTRTFTGIFVRKQSWDRSRTMADHSGKKSAIYLSKQISSLRYLIFHTQKKNNFDNLPPPKANHKIHHINHGGADITQNGHRLSVVHHPLKPPLQSSLTQHLPYKSACQS